MNRYTIPGMAVLALCALPAICQQNNSQEFDSQNGNVPIYRITVVERTMKAINYQYRNGPTIIDFRGTVLLPKAKGEATVESKQGRTEIDARFENLITPQTFGREYLTYVLWAITPEGRPRAIGEIVPNSSNKASLHVTTDLQAFGLIVTAEPYSAVRKPSDVVVAENAIRPETVGKIEEVNAKYELMPRGHYTWQKSQPLDEELANTPKVSMKKYEAILELYQARNAVAIARNAQADQYAPNTFAKAQQLLTEAEQWNANKSADSRRVVESAREAAQTAEDARVIAEQHRQEEKIAQANAQLASAQQARVQAEAQAEQARAQASAAQAEVDAERAARQRAEVEAAAAQDRAMQAQEAARTTQAKATAAILSRQREEQIAADKTTAKTTLRRRLVEQLNAALATRDTPRGIVVTLADRDFAGSALRGTASGQLARISEVIAAHPGLRVRVEGHTDSESSEAVAQRRAQTVRDTLVNCGLPANLIEARPMGNEHPLTSNATANGREENRRVEVVIFGDPIGTLPFWDHAYSLTERGGSQ